MTPQSSSFEPLRKNVSLRWGTSGRKFRLGWLSSTSGIGPFLLGMDDIAGVRGTGAPARPSFA